MNVNKKFCVFFLVLFINYFKGSYQDECINLWKANLDIPNQNICLVLTTNQTYCKFPFVYNGIEYSTCIINNDLNWYKSPQCITETGVWSNCVVETDAMIDFVTTRKNGNRWINGVSLNGGTMLWIYGKRFANNKFSFTPTGDTSNQVYLTNDYASYECTIHPDKVTSTQITCYAPAMSAGTYNVRVKVNGFLIPKYQYTNYDTANIIVSDGSTPKIYSITPMSAVPGSLISINGNFKTLCYTRDVDPCADDSGSRISRIYFSGQLCNLVNPLTNDVYQNITSTDLVCRLEGTEVNVFNVTMLVSEEYGRSLISNTAYFTTPDEKIYNFLSFAEIKSITPQFGSVLGGTKLTLIGAYFYHDDYLPAQIDIAGTFCKVISFEKNNYDDSKLVCETQPKPTQTTTNYYGGRGITVIMDNVFTAYANLATAVPSASATLSISNQANYIGNSSGDSTIWMKGFIVPGKSSNYEFSISTTGFAVFYLSESETPSNKSLVSALNSASNINTKGKKFLNANNHYYFELIGSKQSGSFNLSLNARMFDTVLIDQVSSNVKNEIQEIEISSVIIPEAFNVNFSNLNVSAGVSEVQQILLNSSAKSPFALSFDGVETVIIDFDSTDVIIQNALNDLPSLSPNLATVSLVSSPDAFTKQFTITFSAALGDVPNIQEALGGVSFDVNEITKGESSGEKIQLLIENKPTPVFDLRDSSSNISTSIAESFGIRCPVQLITKSSDVYEVYDYETCTWSDKPINETAFCGKCSLKNQATILSNLNSSLTYKYLCFAYKLTQPITRIYFQLLDPFSNIIYPYADVITTADFNWHYICVDIYDSYTKTQATKLTQAALKLFKVSFGPLLVDAFIDAVSVRKTYPLGYDDARLSTTRRLYPNLQIFQSTYSVNKNGSSLIVSYRPNNCSYNLQNVSVRQKFSIAANNLNVNNFQLASPPVVGTFDLSWNGESILGVPSDISEISFKNYLETVKNFGLSTVTRSKDCAGYKWRIKWTNGGDKPQFIISNTNLTGNNVTTKVSTYQDGSVNFYPLLDDFLRTTHSSPQVVVTINNIPSKCSSSCTFEWLDSATPQVDSIDTTNPSSVVLTGSGFDTNKTNNIVKIGETLCVVTTSTQTQITCTPGEGPVGFYNFTVNIIGKGWSRMNTGVQYEFKLTSSGINPSTGGTGGGLQVNITGSGFSKNTKVYIDNNPCNVLYNTYSLITCVVPSNPTSASKLVDVFLMEGTYNNTLTQKFNYDFVNTPIVTSISQSKLSILGGERITITGTNFPSPLSKVLIGNKTTKIISSSNIEIVIDTPSNQPGLYDLIIPSGTYGNAKVPNQIEYEFYISSFTPQLSSLRGGSLVTIYGNGFSTNCSANVISFERYSCTVKSCTKNSIVCQTESAHTVYEVDNTGHSPSFGEGYAWSNSYINLKIGDYVKWSWSPPSAVPGLKFKVEQLSNAFSFEAMYNGFTSGDAVEKGSYTYQFNQPGSFYYWSGYADVTNVISFRGTVVVGDVVDKDLDLDVTINGIYAQKCVFPFEYKSVTYNSCTNVDKGFNWCSPTKIASGQFLPCDPISTVATPSCSSKSVDKTTCNGTSLGLYTMKYTSCQVPKITSVDPLKLTYNSEITITGTGFSTTSCENEAYINGLICLITSSSATRIICKLGINSGLEPNKLYGVNVLVKNIGYALQDDYYQLRFFSVVSSISQTQGSTAGGAKVTISGDGFTQGTTVLFGSNIYDKSNANITYSSITLITHPNTGLYNVSVSVNKLEVIYENSINYEFSASSSPVLSSASPLTVNDRTELTLSGSNFVSNISLINVKIGTVVCAVSSATATEIKCTVDGVNLGAQSVNINIQSLGNVLANSIKITGQSNLKSITPSSGSINGGSRVSILGNGFDDTSVVKLDQAECQIEKVSVNEIICKTSAHAAQSVAVQVTTNGNVFNNNGVNFVYDSSLTPVISSISPDHENNVNSLLTITGSGFSTNSSEVHVSIDGFACSIQSSSLTEIKCILGAHGAGTYPLDLQIDSKGYANKNVNFKYDLSIQSLSNTESGVGGGLYLKITGSGFSSSSKVLICNKECKYLNSTTSELNCIVPKSDVTNADSTCTLVIMENGINVTTSFNYKLSITPSVTSSSPLRGGTGGGTLVTIIGNNFPVDSSLVTVTIAGSVCDISNINDTTIQCRTGSYSSSSIKTLIQVYVKNVGNALNTNGYFEYIDRWSSKFTWGGMDPPGEGEIAIISNSQTIYFDTTTPVLKGVIIIGGALIFDDNQDVHLQAEYIIIVDGGKLQIGTEDKPFMHKAQLTMYGTARSIELPIFGSKVIAVRNGTLDMHGKPVGVTWTVLGQTANAGSTQITLKEPVDWDVGSEIVIATTGDKFSPGESEVRKITDKSADKRTLILDRALNFTHLSVAITVGSGADTHVLEKRAEVGLLSRNILYRGSQDDSWNSLKSAKACPQGFNPSEFATQTCFLGRYGDEVGSDEFGATIMLHADMSAPRTREYVIARIQNVEFYHVGQSYRIGRYPVHFHMNGDMPSSYVKECAIHQSFNRAVNIHASNYITIERNVIYDIMGGAFFLEDGVEIGNIFSYNLAIFVKTSSSLVNEDSTPAAFWATNANNSYLHNAIGGATHHGFWYRILDTPDGPSFNPNYCPKKMVFGKWLNNTVHSSGRIGLWIFPGYTPTISGACWDNRPSTAKFIGLYSYGNDKGGEWVFSNNLQFRNFVIFDQFSVGIETKNIVINKDYSTNIPNYIPTFYNEETGPVVMNSIIVGNSDSSSSTSITESGLVLAWDRGQLIKNMTFLNFPDGKSHAMRGPEIIGTCTFGCGGWINRFAAMKFLNVRYKTVHRWDWDLIYQDMDGSLTGGLNSTIVYNNNLTITNPNCRTYPEYLNGTVCTNIKGWIRYAWNNLIPDLAVLANYTNDKNQMATIPKLAKRLTHKKGFMASIEANQEYLFEYDAALFPTNISYDSGFYNIEPNNYVIIKHRMSKKPDRVYIGPTLQTESYTPLTSSSDNGNWHWDNGTVTLSYILTNKAGVQPFIDYEIGFNAYRCRYAGCKPPEQPGFKLPVKSRPADALFWSNISTWSFAEPGWGGFVNKAYQLPKAFESVKIPDGKYVVVDCPIPPLKYLVIEGVLEFDNGFNHTLEADLVFINGGQLIIGWENNPMLNNVEIKLNGQKDSLNFYLPDGFNTIGGKGIGVYGGLDLHGRPRYPSWTQLSVTSLVGSNTITLKDPVDWQVGEMIVIGPTSYNAKETEVFTITQKSDNNRTLTLNATLVYDHRGFTESFSSGDSYTIGAGVGLLSRNIKIIGVEYDQQLNDLYGTRIIVSDYSTIGSDGINYFYKGYARVSDVEFVHPGQYSRNSGDDYKYGILFSNLQEYNYSRPSYVRNCAFRHGFSAAVGILGSMSIPIEDNVIHHTIDYGIEVQGHSNIIRRNFIVLVYWAATFRTWEAPYNAEYRGAIQANEADSLVLENNFIAGSERLGLLYKGDVCPGDTLGANMNHSIKNNIFYSCMAGVVILPDMFFENITCISMNTFTVYKSIYWGIYYQGEQIVIVENNKLIDNFVGVITIIIGPAPILHIFSGKTYRLENTLIVGQSKEFNCVKDVRPDDLNVKSASKIVSTGAGPDKMGKIGIVWPNFLGSSNAAPFKPWPGIMTFNALDGHGIVTNVTFANFDQSCGIRNYVITQNFDNYDGQHPVSMSRVKLQNVQNESKVWLHRSDLGLINIWRCIDMDCEAMKKSLLNDLDGSFLGSKGSVIPESEYQWGSQQRGIGDFRIPKEALAAANGSMIPPSQFYDFPGIVRDQNLCKYRSDWQGYECHGLEYRMLMIESMDPDSLTRRLSPVAVISDNKYLDLINGPSDHGCCFGYNCRKRLSTFMVLVVANRSYDIYLTSTAPKQLRFRILNADSSFKIRLSMHYFTSNRIDVYKNDTFVSPTNAKYVNGNMMLEDTTNNLESYKPKYYNESGSNLAVRADSKVYFAIHGADYIDLKITPTVFVKFGVPAITDSSFFDPARVAQNFAALLGVDVSKIRKVEIIRETSKRRRRGAADTVYIALTIFENPVNDLNDNTASESINTTMKNLTATIINQFSTGELQAKAQSKLNITITGLIVQKSTSNGTDAEITKINNIKVIQEADKCREQSPCEIQPILMVLDEYGDPLLNMGSDDFPWLIEAIVLNSSNPNLKITNQTEAKLDDDGYVRFSGLAISDIADSFKIKYQFKTPTGVNQSTFKPLTLVSENAISSTKAELSCKSNEDGILVNENERFNITVSLIDKISESPLKNISWKNHLWQVTVGMYQLSKCNSDGLLKTDAAITSVDTQNSIFKLNNLYITGKGMYMLLISIKTSNGDYDFYCGSKAIMVKPSTQAIKINDEIPPTVYFTFLGNFSEYKNRTEYFKSIFYNCIIIKYNLTVSRSIIIYEGSVMVNTEFTGEPNSITQLATDIAANGFSLDPSLKLDKLQLFDKVISLASNTTITTTSAVTTTNPSIISDSPKKQTNESYNTTGLIVGLVFGILAIILIPIIIVFAYNIYKRKKHQQEIVYPNKRRGTISKFIANLKRTKYQEHLMEN